LRAVWDSALDAMLVADDEGRYVDANPAACALFGRSRDELLSSTVRDVVETSDLQWRAFRESGQGAGESTIVRRDGERRQIEGTGLADVLPGRHLTVLRDVTERRRLQEELWRAQKLESVGRLAGGVAQDFNNLLTAIRGHAHLLQSRTAPESVEHDHAQEIDRVAGRAAALTSKLLALGRRQMLQASPVDLNLKVERMREELVEAVGAGIDLVFELDPALCAVHVDRGVVSQAICNLVVNAADAMPDGGSLVVSTTVEQVEGRNDLPDGRYAVLRVADDGPGIESAFFDHVFEPFFTTKGPGEGAGLGLASAYGTIRQSGGTITVESALGEGSTFSIYLPEASVVSERAARGGGETLVVVERDPAVRDVLRELLTDAGYRVVPAGTSNDAQRLAGRNDLAIDLVVADLDDHASAQLAAELEASRPGLRLVQVAKPFTPGRLYDFVRAGLAAPERRQELPI
jgi:two-component system, cell cycle sensor histidine kinase and response regulator CckA